jgi:predicted TIM-barrel fold metal-dependent hydrolase
MKSGVLGWAIVISVLTSLHAQSAPVVDHHQHLFNPAITKLSPSLKPISASDLIALLDAAGVGRALVLSVAYQFSNPNKPPFANEYTQVKPENDWTSQQVARFPDRLRGFCSVNPLKDYAPEEIARCARDSHLRFGLKLHFGNSDVDVGNPEHVTRLRKVFQTANQHGMAIVIHMRPSITRQRPYGAKQAQEFLNDVLPAAADVPVQIAHLSGAGGYDDPAVDQALGVFADAIAKHDPRMKRVYFDVAGVVEGPLPDERARLIAKRIRQLGVSRILYGSDGAAGGNLAPREAWAAFRKLPLSEVEFHAIASNVAPYMQ